MLIESPWRKEPEAICQDWVESPRWAQVPNYIRNLAWSLDLELCIEVETGFINQTTRFKVGGTHESVNKFMEQLQADTKAYMSRRGNQ